MKGEDLTQSDSCGIDTFKLGICGPERFSAYNIKKEYVTTSRDPDTRIFFDTKNRKTPKFEMATNDTFERVQVIILNQKMVVTKVTMQYLMVKMNGNEYLLVMNVKKKI